MRALLITLCVLSLWACKVETPQESAEQPQSTAEKKAVAHPIVEVQPWGQYLKFSQSANGMPALCSKSVGLKPRKAQRTSVASPQEKQAYAKAHLALSEKKPAELIGSVPEKVALDMGRHLYALGRSYAKATDIKRAFAAWECAAFKYMYPRAAEKVAVLYYRGSKALKVDLDIKANKELAYFWLLNAIAAGRVEGELYSLDSAQRLAKTYTVSSAKENGFSLEKVEAIHDQFMMFLYPNHKHPTGWASQLRNAEGTSDGTQPSQKAPQLKLKR